MKHMSASLIIAQTFEGHMSLREPPTKPQSHLFFPTVIPVNTIESLAKVQITTESNGTTQK